MNLSRATWTDIEACETDLAMVPIGSTEQHGPHAPLGTDWMTATAVAESASDRYSEEVIVAPTIPVGIAEEHRHFPGTMWVSEDTFRSYVRESVASLAYHGFDRVVLVNGHGGNIDALREVAGTITRHDEVYAVPFTWFDAVGDHGNNMGHGGPLETALIKHIDDELIRNDRLDVAAAGSADGWGDWVSGTNLAYDSSEFTDNGVVGDPRGGDEQLGSELLELATEALIDLLDAVAARDSSSRR